MADWRREVEAYRLCTAEDRLSSAEATAMREAMHTRRPMAVGPRLAWGGAGLVLATAAVLIAVTGEASWYSVTRGGSCLTGQGNEVRSTCAATIAWQGHEAELEAVSELHREEGAMRLARGEVRFRSSATDSEPLVVRVSHGTIVPRGTVFVARQNNRGGSLTVEQGAVDFVWQDETVERINKGATLRWPRAQSPAVEPEPKPDEPEPEPSKKPPAPKPSIEQLMARLAQLKGQERIDDAVALLRKNLRASYWTERQRESLSLELGMLLESAGRSAEACVQWRNHLRDFPHMRFRRQLEQSLSRCP